MAAQISKANERLKLSKIWDLYLKSPKRSECCQRYLEQKRVVWQRFTLDLQLHGLSFFDEITEEHLFRWLQEQRKIRSGKTVNDYLIIIRHISSFFGKRDEFKDIQKWRVVTKHMDHFQKEDLEKVFNAIDGEMDLSVKYREEMQVLFRIGAYTGLRMKDACLLRWSHVNFSRNLINCTPYKTIASSEKIVWIPMNTDLRTCLEATYSGRKSKQRDSDYVLQNLAERYLTEPSLIQHPVAMTMHWAMWDHKQKGMRPPRIGKYGFHSFRHTFISFCANAGVPLAFVQEVVGQNSEIVTWYYTHLTTESMQQVIDALPSFKNLKI